MDPYVLDLATSFVLGGIWVMAASMAAQHFGGNVGGFIAGLPSTAVLAIFFITYSEGASHGFDVTGIFPLTISVNAVFLAAFAALSEKIFSTGLLSALGIWLLIQSMLLNFHHIRFDIVIWVGVLLFAVSLSFVNRLYICDPDIRTVQHKLAEIIIRGGAGGSIVILAARLMNIGTSGI